MERIQKERARHIQIRHRRQTKQIPLSQGPVPTTRPKRGVEIIVSTHYEAAKSAARAALADHPDYLVTDDSDEVLSIAGPSESHAPLEIDVGGGKFQVLIGTNVSFDEAQGRTEDIAREVALLIEIVRHGIDETTWSRGGQTVIATVSSKHTGFRATTRSSLFPKCILQRSTMHFTQY